ncbi:OmpA family protein [Piscinibacter sp.]|uniref:OmpA family protein n=1 Tax=Piscinibacter sp. TaxID=1903157 RepID=UPI0039E668E6
MPFRATTLAATALAAFCGTAFAQGTQQQPATLAPEAARISDGVIQQDHKVFETVQARIKSLNDGGRRVADYHLSKAQCWLDVSFHEYTRNDRSQFPQAALTESDKLVIAMENKVQPLPMDTPLVNGAARLRPDLWERLTVVQRSSGFNCAMQRAACAEVELVHAGNEFNQQGWRHAKPYVQMAEDMVAEAEQRASTCNPAPAPAVAPPAPAPAAVPCAPCAAAEDRRVRLFANVVFAFDRHGRADIRAGSREQLDEMLATIRREKLTVESVELAGHADRLNSTGNPAYNQKLSERRAETVRALLVERGIPAQAITATAVGDTQQVEGCERTKSSQPALQECLLPNRRVTVNVTATRPSR